MSRKMKDSGIGWIGKIHEGWEVHRLKNLFAYGKGLPITKENLVEDGVPVISYGQIHSKLNSGVKITDNLIRFVPVSFLKSNPDSLVDVYDFIFADTSEDIVGCGNCVYIDKNITIFAGYHTIILRSIRKKNNKYLAYLFQTDVWRSQIRAMVTGVKVFSISKRIFGIVSVVLPPISEQQQIASYLDSKCLEMDGLTADIKKQLEILEQYRKSVIIEAVTKGLNPNIKVKESHIGWVGKVPYHWKLSKIKNELDNLDYLREPISAEKRENTLRLYDYYGASGVIDKIDDFNIDDTVLLIGEDGANLLTRNLPLIYRVSGKFWVNNHAHILKVHDNNSYGFIAYLLESGDYTVYITGSAQPKLSQFNLMHFPITIPPIEEQQKIASYLDGKCSKIDELIKLKNQQLEMLSQYKKSLIYEYVTGKRRLFNDRTY